MGTKVEDGTVKTVVSVEGTTPFKEIVRLMDSFRASALPVVDEVDRVVGVVSEAELLLKEGSFGEESGPIARWRHRTERARIEGTTARQIMDPRADTIRPDVSVAEAARLMVDRRVIRVPVVDANGRIVGMVSWRDLLKVFLRPDEELRKEIVEWIEGQLCQPPYTVTVNVRDGIVTLAGQLERESLVPIVVEFARSVDGVVGIVDRLSYLYGFAEGPGTLGPTTPAVLAS